ncbi:bifunctional epoxide hydrolase 2-like protein [Tanacetum coccineum]
MDQIVHKFLEVNGLKVHIAEIGNETSPVVVFVHGFPEIYPPPDTEKFGFSDIVDDLLAIVDSLGDSLNYTLQLTDMPPRVFESAQCSFDVALLLLVGIFGKTVVVKVEEEEEKEGYDFDFDYALTKRQNINKDNATKKAIATYYMAYAKRNKALHMATRKDHVQLLTYSWNQSLKKFEGWNIAYIPCREVSLILQEVYKYDNLHCMPKIATWIEELNKIDAYVETKDDPKYTIQIYKKRLLGQRDDVVDDTHTSFGDAGLSLLEWIF